MKEHLDTIRARELVEEACKLAGHKRLAKKISIVWSTRATTRLGMASRATFEITLSKKAWRLISEDDKRETIFHEVAHLISFHEEGIIAWGHTLYWRLVMASLGYPEAERCHTLTAALETLRRPVKRAIAICDCTSSVPSKTHRSYNGDHFVTLHKVKRIKKGERFVCRSCGSTLKLTGQVITI